MVGATDLEGEYFDESDLIGWVHSVAMEDEHGWEKLMREVIGLRYL